MKKKVLLTIALVVLLFCFFAACASTPVNGGGEEEQNGEDEEPVVAGAVYYCAVDGDNENDGSETSPWRTPGFASRQLVAGDMLIIKEGEYVLGDFPDDIITPASGEQGAPIIIQGEGPGQTVLKGSNNLYSGIILDGVSNIVIRDLEITHEDSSMFRDAINGTAGSVEQILFENLYIHHVDEFGMNFKDISNATITQSTITYCGFGAIGGPGGDSGWQDCMISDCSLAYSGHYYQGELNNPDNPYGRPDGIGLEPSAGPVVVKDCLVTHNRGDGIDLKTKNASVMRCEIGNNYGDGLKLWGDGSLAENCLIYGTGDGDINSPWSPVVIEQSSDPGAEFKLKNITVHDNPLRQSYSIYSQYNISTPLSLEIINCTFSGAYGVAFFGENVELSIKNSNFHAPNRDEQIIYKGVEYNAEDLQDCAFGEGIISEDPGFINPVWGDGRGDYHLTEGSPLIDSGTATDAPKDDLDKTSRPQGTGYDIGAYEQAANSSEVLCSSYSQIRDAVEAASSGGSRNIMIEPGNYEMETALILNVPGLSIKGNSSNPSDVVLDGGGIFLGNSHIFLVSASHTTLENLTLQGVGNHAVQVRGEISVGDFSLRNCIIRDTGEQMLKVSYDPADTSQRSYNGLVEDCLFEYSENYGPQYYIGGVDVHNGVDWIVRNSTFRNIRSPADSLAEHAIHFWSNSENTLVENNTIINCDRGIGFGLGDRGHIGGIIRNNMIYHEDSDDFGDVGIGVENAEDAQIYNNTIFFEHDYPNAIEYRFPGTVNCQITNNLTNKAITLRDGATGSQTTNVTNALSEWFVNPFSGNLHLAAAVEDVINSGSPLEELTEDYDGQTRPIETGVEIGADEVDSSTLPEWPDTPVDYADRIFNTYTYSNATNDPLKSYQETRVIPGDEDGQMELAFRLYHYGEEKEDVPLLVQIHEWGGDFARMENLASYCPSEYSFVMLAFQFIPSSINESCWWYGTHWEGALHPWAEEAVIEIINEISATSTSETLNNLDSGISIDRDRVYLFGHSIGGTGTFQIGLRNPDVFAAIHAHSGFSTFTPEDDLFRPLFEREIVGSASDGVTIQTPYGTQSAREYTDLDVFLDTFHDNAQNLPFVLMTAGTGDDLISPAYGGDRVGKTLDRLRQGFFYHRHNGGHSEDCFIQLNWLFNFRKDQAYLVFTNRTGYGISFDETVPMGSWTDYVSGGINDLYEMGWAPSSIVDTEDDFSVTLTGEGAADCTIRNTQRFMIEAGEQYYYRLNDSGDYHSIFADGLGLITLSDISGGDKITLSADPL